MVTAFALVAFASNSILCRLALTRTAIDPATFTSIRLLAGAAVLWLILRVRDGSHPRTGNWWSGFALFAYAAGFSFAYVHLSAGTGALLLFAAVQATMIGYGLFRGERLHAVQGAGLVVALGGLVLLLWPGLTSPPLLPALLMAGAGMSWGIYSLRGRGALDPTGTTAGNFLRSIPFTLALSAVLVSGMSIDHAGALYAIASGALTSALGYIVWYTAVRELPVTIAATVQLSVPLLAAVAGVVIVGEPPKVELMLAALLILGGIALVIHGRPRPVA